MMAGIDDYQGLHCHPGQCHQGHFGFDAFFKTYILLIPQPLETDHVHWGIYYLVNSHHSLHAEDLGSSCGYHMVFMLEKLSELSPFFK